MRFISCISWLSVLLCSAACATVAEDELGTGGATNGASGGAASGGASTVSSSGGTTTSSGGNVTASGGEGTVSTGGSDTSSGGSGTGGTDGSSTGGTAATGGTGGSSSSGAMGGSSGGGDTCGGRPWWDNGTIYQVGDEVTSVCADDANGSVSGCVAGMKQGFECKDASWCHLEPGVDSGWWDAWDSVQQCP